MTISGLYIKYLSYTFSPILKKSSQSLRVMLLNRRLSYSSKHGDQRLNFYNKYVQVLNTFYIVDLLRLS